MTTAKLAKCIYCLSEKPENEYNVEHVVPRLFGRHENSYTLHDHQVCENCNTYFSNTFEDSISLDSFEALLRMTRNKKIMSDGRILRDNRIKVLGDSGVFKGLTFRVVTDQTSPERVTFIPEPAIGIIENECANEYEYFTPENFPLKTAEIAERLKRIQKSIIFWSIEKEEMEKILTEKGYTFTEFMHGKDIKDIYSEPELETILKLKLDRIMIRFVAKIAFNYFTYKYGKHYMLLEKFDPIRRYIRYGTDESDIFFSFSKGKVMNFFSQNDAHIVGLVWGDQSHKSVYGVVSWFNEATYKICLCNNMCGISHKLPISIFDNQKGKIFDTEQMYYL